ncbi:MAG: hypothetical protein ABIW17_05615 [Marmoricola sp.]
MSDTEEHTIGPDDVTLLAAVGRLWQQVDPPPADLADGVLARIAAEDLEFDLLILVESSDALAGVRSAADAEPDEEQDTGGSWQLEYAGSDFKIYLRMTRIEHRTRIDGWVVPARPLTVRLLGEDQEAPQQTVVDQFGRFELADAPSGLARLVFSDETPSADRPRITPPFWI